MLLSTDALWILVGALAIDALIGDPDFLWRRWHHPVALLGALIDFLDRWLNRETWSQSQRQLAGVVTLMILVLASAVLGSLMDSLLRRLPGGEAFVALVASVFIAQRSLYEHVDRVRGPLANDDVAAARKNVSMIVGREPESLDEAGICRAAIESCAENFSDGVVAPALCFAVFGLPGLIAYKAVNTADSIIGHRNARYEAFGWAAARFDDLINLVPARIAGVLIALAGPIAGGHPVTALRVMIRDARLHCSPNAGWPESAMAGALGIALAGPRRYGEHLLNDPFLNAGARTATAEEVGRALRVLISACLIHAALYAAVALAL